MTVAEQHLLIDATNLAVLLLGVSFMFRRVMASRYSLPPAGTHGKVRTRSFELPELALALTFISLLYATVRYPAVRDFKGHPAMEFVAQNSLLLMLFVVLVVTGGFRRHDLVELFGFDRLRGRPLLIWTLVSFVVITLSTFFAMWLWQLWIRDLTGPPKPQDSIRLLRENPKLLLPTFFNAAIAAPFIEELLFRGFLYPALKRYSQPLVALVVTASIFAAIHLHVPALLPLFVLSCLLTCVYELCGSLWVPILVHAGFNAVNIAITASGFLFSYVR